MRKYKGKRRPYRGRGRKGRRYRKKGSLFPAISSTYKHRVCGMVPVVVNGSAATSYNLSYTFPVNFPGYGSCTTNAEATRTAQSHTLLSAWSGGFLDSKYATLNGAFDEYRVAACRIRYIANELDVRANTAQGDLVDAPRAMYCYTDNDDESVQGNESIVLDMGIRPKADSLGDGGISYQARKTAIKKQFMNSSTIQTKGGDAITGNTVVPVTAYGAVKILFVGQITSTLNTSYYQGRLYIEWDVIYRGVTNS